MNNKLSYSSIYSDKQNFKKSGTGIGSTFNKYDSPSQKYFKILFYFYNGAEGVSLEPSSDGGVGLLHPTWQNYEGSSDTLVLYKHNTAYSYLFINGESERADLLKEFVSLLSDISSESPWYFSEITGLDTALERNVKEIKIEEERKKISIKCLPDAFDDRIGTLMDLYRAIVWSWQMKREVVPANLRKFDMGIYIFNDAVEPFHKMGNKLTDNLPEWLSPDEYAVMGSKTTGYTTSYKYVEFHNCEFDYNSGKTPYGTLSNKDGLQPEYTIDIFFDDCYETHYNEFIMKEIGDMIKWDVNIFDNSRFDYNKSSKNKWDLDKRLNYYEGGFLANAADQLLTAATDWVGSKVKGAVLGNLYKFSLTKIGNQISTLMNGGIMETANAIGGYIRDAKQRNAQPEGVGDNMFIDSVSSQHASTDTTVNGNIFDNSVSTRHTHGEVAIENGNKYFNESLDRKIFEIEPTQETNTTLGNIFSAQTLANNL